MDSGPRESTSLWEMRARITLPVVGLMWHMRKIMRGFEFCRPIFCLHPTRAKRATTITCMWHPTTDLQRRGELWVAYSLWSVRDDLANVARRPL